MAKQDDNSNRKNKTTVIVLSVIFPVIVVAVVITIAVIYGRPSSSTTTATQHKEGIQKNSNIPPKSRTTRSLRNIDPLLRWKFPEQSQDSLEQSTSDEWMKRLKGQYCINLDRRPDRWDTFKSKCPRYLPVERFSAADCKNMVLDPLDPYENMGLEKKNGSDQYEGELGCFLSHYRIWKKLAFDPNVAENDFYIVFEDDVDFIDKSEHNFYAHVRQQSFDFDLFWIGGRFRPGFTLDEKALGFYFTKLDSNLYYQRDWGVGYAPEGTRNNFNGNYERTTHSYLVSKCGARKLVEQAILFSRAGSPRAIAVDFYMMFHRNRMINLEIYPHICYSEGKDSDVR
jgi:GR25 family glycosyltransferase involved in LPS biosynthesis